MADTTKKIIIDISILNDDAIANIKNTTKEIDRLKAAQAALKAAGKENSDEFIKNTAVLKNLNSVVKANEKELQNNLNQQKANSDSLNALRAQLKSLIATYDDLSAADRNSSVGTNVLKSIQDLTSQISTLENDSGRFQRNVGNYKSALDGLADGTISAREALRSMRESLMSLQMQYSASANKIKEQENLINELAITKGKESAEYQKAVSDLNELNSAYTKTGQKIKDMTVEAGQLSDTYKDVQASISSAGTDAANIQAINQGTQLLADGYTVLTAGMSALGIESEDLINVFAKLNIVQQAANSIQQISLALQPETILMQKLRVLWNTLTTKSIGTLIKAKQADVVASSAAAAGNVLLAKGENAATRSAGFLTVALNTVKKTIYSIPIIGWLAAAVALIGTVIGLIRSANKEEERSNAILQERIAKANEFKAVEIEAVKSVSAGNIQMQKAVERVNSLTEGSKEWKSAVGDVAKKLGVSEEWLIKNKDRIFELSNAWIQLQKNMAVANAYMQKMADSQTNQAQLSLDIAKSKTLNKKDVKEYVANLKETYNLTISQTDKLTKALKKYNKSRTVENEKTVNDIVSNIQDGLKETELSYEAEADKALKLTNAYQSDIDSAVESSGTKAKSTIKSVSDTYKKLKEDELKDEISYNELILNSLTDSIDKQIAEYSVSIDKQINENKNKYAELSNQLKTANAKEKEVILKHQKVLNDSIILLEGQKLLKISELREQYSRDNIQKEYENLKALNELRLKTAGNDIKKQYEAEKVNITLEYTNNKQSLNEALADAQKILNENKDKLSLSDDILEPFASALQLSVDDYRAALNAANLDKTKEIEYILAKLKLLSEAYYKDMDSITGKYNNSISEMIQKTAQTNSDSYYAHELNLYKDNEYQKTSILLEQSQKRLEQLNSEREAVLAMSDEIKVATYGSMEAYNLELATINSQIQSGKDEVADYNNTLNDLSDKAQNTLITTLGNTAGAFADLFNQLAESNADMSDFAIAMSMVQILANSAVAISEAVNAAMNAGMGTGVAAPFTTPLFIAQLVGIVVSGIAQSMSVINQAKSVNTSKPTFATGGLINQGQSGIDKVPIMATKGEYIIKKDTVDEFGVDFFDSINKTKKSKGGRYAEGGKVIYGIKDVNNQSVINNVIVRNSENAQLAEQIKQALQGMENVVSVKEITNIQKRVKVKETISAK